MTIRRIIIAGLATLSITTSLAAQTTTKSKTASAKAVTSATPGTVLTASVVTTTQPVTERTTTVTDGTVWYVSGNYVIVTLANGENHEYKVPPSYKFMVEGKPASVSELRKGMKVSATRIVEEPKTEMETTTVVTGKAPKK